MRGLLVLVVVMGVLIVAGVATVGVTITRRLSARGSRCGGCHRSGRAGRHAHGVHRARGGPAGRAAAGRRPGPHRAAGPADGRRVRPDRPRAMTKAAADQGLRRMWPPVHVAPQMGARLGRGALLLRRLPHRPPRRGDHPRGQERPCETARFGLTQRSATSCSSRGLGHRPLTAVTGVRIPYGTPACNGTK